MSRSFRSPSSLLVWPSATVCSKKEAWDRLNQWFWSGVFGEFYGSSAVKLRAARDVDEVTAWVGESEVVPKTVQDATFRESRLLSIDESDGVWHGLYALLMARGARDWRTGTEFNRNTFEELKPGFFPVFPLNWCKRHGVSEVLANSVLNRTPWVSARKSCSMATRLNGTCRVCSLSPSWRMLSSMRYCPPMSSTSIFPFYPCPGILY